ncbi:MAG: DUF2950 domain-containing protein [Acetobacteraceae bacterium]|nr:DUF2950 domain-containing protein [Acetobacteraceae bacterium]
MTLWLEFARGPLAAPQPAQRTFASPEEAARALAEATRSHNTAGLQAIFGSDGDKLISSGDRYADEEMQRRFAALYDQKHELMQQGPEHVQLEVGPDHWPLPILIVQSGGRWHFDTQAGAQEIINRRIGRNELSAIRVSLAYVDAQKDFFARTKQETGTGVYAERLVSTPGQQDGLYWPVPTGGPESPLGPLIEAAEEQGYPGEIVGGKPDPYQGYYFRILEGQGPNAPEGPRNYVRSGRMTDGFALIAWPASYGSSGIMSFEVNQDGLVFQKDLGSDTAQAAARITLFDPDLTWTRVDVTNN